MNNIKRFALSLLFLLVIPASALAIGGLVVKVEVPKSPYNQDNFKLNFVALDVNNNPVTVKCFKKAPTESSFTQFDGDKVLKAGGNSGFCSVTSSVLNSEGTYKFYVEANAVMSDEVSVDYKTSTPGTPHSYSKNKTGTCEYTIKVTTNNDGGKTSRIVLYRSDSLSFTADGASQVDSRNVGSDTVVEMKNSIPDCNKTYYFAVRAFDSVGNGSGVVGDEVSVTTGSTVSTSSTNTNSGATSTTAIPVETSSVTNPEAVSSAESPNQEIPVTPSISPEILGTQTKDPFWKTKSFRIGVIVVLAGLFISQRKKGK